MTVEIEKLVPWLTAVRDLDVAKAVACYDADAVLLATFSHETRKGHAAIESYFETFLTQASLRCEIIESFEVVTQDLVVLSGRYSFLAQSDSSATVQEIPARFTFVFKPSSDGSWKIFHHHSSQLPTG